MKLRNAFMTAIACSVLVFAGGSTGNQSPGGSGSAGSSGMGDTMMVSGTIQQFSSSDSMLVVKSDTGTDTIYFNDQTQMPSSQQLQQGTQVQVQYTNQNGRKEAVMISSGSSNQGYGGSSGSGSSSDTSQGYGGSSDTNQGYGGSSDTGMGGSSDTNQSGAAGQGSQMMVAGKVETVNQSDSMFVLQSNSGETDTLYFDQNTQMQQSQLKKGNQVVVQYQMKNNRKVATKVAQYNENQSGSGESQGY